MLSSLEKRVFLMHNVHDAQPVLFQTRWTMAYLRGPLGREEIARLAPRPVPGALGVPEVFAVPGVPKVPESPGEMPGVPTVREVPGLPEIVSAASRAEPHAPGAPSQPVIDPAISQYFAPGEGSAYAPALLGAARIVYSDAKLGVDDARDAVVITPIVDGVVPVDWEHAEPAPFSVRELSREATKPLPFAPLPSAAMQPKKFAQWQKDFARWAAQSQSLELLRSDRAKITSHPDEDERDFRIRVQAALREARDAAVAKTRQKHASKLAAAEDRLRRAEAAVQREEQQSSESKLQAGVSLAATIAGALLGRKAVSVGTLGRATTAARGMGRIGREAQDVARAQATVAALRQARDELAANVASEMQQVGAAFDASTEEFTRVLVKPKRGGVSVQVVAVVWVPRS
jgi:hypothetical protein